MNSIMNILLIAFAPSIIVNIVKNTTDSATRNISIGVKDLADSGTYE